MPIIKHLKHIVENFDAYQTNIKHRSTIYKACLTDVNNLYDDLKNIDFIIEFDSFWFNELAEQIKHDKQQTFQTRHENENIESLQETLNSFLNLIKETYQTIHLNKTIDFKSLYQYLFNCEFSYIKGHGVVDFLDLQNATLKMNILEHQNLIALREQIIEVFINILKNNQWLNSFVNLLKNIKKQILNQTTLYKDFFINNIFIKGQNSINLISEMVLIEFKKSIIVNFALFSFIFYKNMKPTFLVTYHNLIDQAKNILSNIPNLTSIDISENNSIDQENQMNKKLTSLPHWEIAQAFELVDFKDAVNISKSRFVAYKNEGSALIRALINYLIDQAINNGYQEWTPPYIVNNEAIFGTGHLPKFETDLFKINHDFDKTETPEANQSTRNFYLIPTGEVPLTSMLSNKVLLEDELPIKYCAYTPCFRSEAGSYGRDTRGLIRLHQFHKVELVNFATPEQAEQALQNMKHDVTQILEDLQLPYRIILLGTQELGFSAAKTYDVEVWTPAEKRYIEISSVSWCTDFQSRRLNIKYKPNKGHKSQLVHTLNGSGLAIDRLFALILENYYDSEQEVINIPTQLQPYFNHQTMIKKPILKKNK